MTVALIGLGVFVAARIGYFIWQTFFRRDSLWDGELNRRTRERDPEESE